ncbi:MAG: hypothetical protein JWQ23_1368 [Herminiimonas sp.]|nr:hypothetical protein [Herminiimonas sp.]
MTPINTLGIFLMWLMVIPIIFGLSLRVPKLVATGFIVVLFLFSSSTWGQLQAENTIYARGVGMFYFSLLNLALLIAGVATFVRKLANPYSTHLNLPLGKYFLAFVFLLFSHVVLGLMSGVDIFDILGYNGIINILNMLVFMYLVVMAFHNERDTRHLLYTIIALAAVRALFGIIRYVWFDGDSANPYKNFENLDIKILFFDIADNFIASLAAFCAAWLLTSREVRLSLLKRLMLCAFLVLEIAAVALSFRRSSLVGLALMFALLLYRLPGASKWKFLLLGLGMLWVTALVFFQQRLQFNIGDNTGGILSSLIYDIAPEKNLNDNRFYELFAAAKSLGDNWLFGLGSWGTFSGDQELLGYHFGKFDFVHSGFGHIILKAGLVGLLLFCLLLVAYTSYYFRHRKYLNGNARLIADAGFAGFLFWVPTLLIGTPIIEFRSMLLIGLTLAMPFVAVSLEKYRVRTYVVA